MPTGSRRKMKYTHISTLPAMLQYQKDTGITLSPCLSEAIHCTRNRIEKRAFPTKPRTMR